MSKFDPSWPEPLAKAAEADGWLLAYCVDSGAPIGSAYLEAFVSGPKFPNREHVVKHIVQHARAGSALHQNAMAAILASRGTSRKRR